MKSANLVLIGALALAGAAYGQQPPDVVASDTSFNTAMGTNALLSLTPSTPNGSYNTASGDAALYSDTTGSYNTASGNKALFSNTAGNYNTACGDQALFSNTTGVSNTASGEKALFSNTTGYNNTASGLFALYFNNGNYNTASGEGALQENTTGNDNTASGYDALLFNTTGSNNTASGYYALAGAVITTANPDGATGSNNTGIGTNALFSYSTGSNNTASGFNALFSNTTGSNNIAEGYQAGYNLTTGSNNIDIGNVGVAGESNTIRIGTKGTQKATVIAGIYGTPVSGSPVVVSATGRLGVTVSSERYKTTITPMESNSEKLEQLRPVTFHLKTDPHGALQYGLIAEEVANVYPELVIRGEKGRIDGVRYDELTPILVNEVQQQKRTIGAQSEKIDAQAANIHDLRMLVIEMQAGLLKLQSKDELVAKR
jgi:hypothetical protein